MKWCQIRPPTPYCYLPYELYPSCLNIAVIIPFDQLLHVGQLCSDAQASCDHVWDWSWQLRDCELHRLGHIDRIVASLCRKGKCALLSLHKDWLTKHTSYMRSHQELSALADWSGLTVVPPLYALHPHDIYAAGSLLKKLLHEKKNSE